MGSTSKLSSNPGFRPTKGRRDPQRLNERCLLDSSEGCDRVNAERRFPNDGDEREPAPRG